MNRTTAAALRLLKCQEYYGFFQDTQTPFCLDSVESLCCKSAVLSPHFLLLSAFIRQIKWQTCHQTDVRWFYKAARRKVKQAAIYRPGLFSPSIFWRGSHNGKPMSQAIGRDGTRPSWSKTECSRACLLIPIRVGNYHKPLPKKINPGNLGRDCFNFK